MKKCILVIGVRRQCYQAALELGYDVVLWSDETLNKSRKKDLLGWIEQSYSDNSKALSDELVGELKKYDIQHVVSNTEETVILGARVRDHLGFGGMSIEQTASFHDKWAMKNSATKHGIPITKYKIIDEQTTSKDLEQYLGLPLVVKPVDESGAQDVKVARTTKEIDLFMKPGLLAEAFVKGSEVSIETFIENGKPIFHNITEYLHQWRKSVVPAQLEKELETKLLELNDKVIKEFGVDNGMTHAEFYLTDDGPVFGEIAIRPPGGYYMDLIKRVYGFNSWQLYVSLCCGLGSTDYKFSKNGCGAVFIIHPGAGKIKSIEGLADIKENIKDIFDYSIRREVGDIILAHENTSNEVGHILFWNENREKIDLDFDFIESNLKFNFEE